MKQIKYLSLLFLLFALVQCKTQKNNEFKIAKGIVMDETGPIPGAQIIVKGTKKHTQADFDGKFEIQVVKGDTLIITYTGLKTKETKIKSKNYYKIILLPHVKLSRRTKRYYRRYAREHNGTIPEF